MIDSNNNIEYYIYGPKGIIAKRSNNLTYFMLKDHLGSTRVVMNSQNQIVSSYDYDAWGNPLNNTVSEESKYRYTGREYDDETGLHNFCARIYDSVLMRFYQVDPVEQFASPYIYCGNNPIMMIDPDGMQSTSGILSNPVPGGQLRIEYGETGKKPYLSLFGSKIRTNNKGIKTDHTGIDITSPDGTPLVAPITGIVLEAYPNASYGWLVKIAPNDPFFAYDNEQEKMREIKSVTVNHLQSVSVKKGMEIKKDEPIGLSGHSGSAAAGLLKREFHTHVEIRFTTGTQDPGCPGKADPLPFMPQEFQDDVKKLLEEYPDPKYKLLK